MDEMTKRVLKRIARQAAKREAAKQPSYLKDGRFINLLQHGEFDSWTQIFIIKARNEEEAKKFLFDNDLLMEEYNTNFGPYDCTGKKFCYGPIFSRIMANRMTVRYDWYIDC